MLWQVHQDWQVHLAHYCIGSFGTIRKGKNKDGNRVLGHLLIVYLVTAQNLDQAQWRDAILIRQQCGEGTFGTYH